MARNIWCGPKQLSNCSDLLDSYCAVVVQHKHFTKTLYANTLYKHFAKYLAQASQWDISNELQKYLSKLDRGIKPIQQATEKNDSHHCRITSSIHDICTEFAQDLMHLCCISLLAFLPSSPRWHFCFVPWPVPGRNGHGQWLTCPSEETGSKAEGATAESFAKSTMRRRPTGNSSTTGYCRSRMCLDPCMKYDLYLMMKTNSCVSLCPRTTDRERLLGWTSRTRAPDSQHWIANGLVFSTSFDAANGRALWCACISASHQPETFLRPVNKTMDMHCCITLPAGISAASLSDDCACV